MRNSVMLALRKGSAENCERPIQLFNVTPRLAGVSVMVEFSSTKTPSTYNRPVCVAASRVHTTCFGTPAGRRVPIQLTCCSPLPVVMEARRLPSPDCGVANRYCVPLAGTFSPPELLPKSKMRAHAPLLLSVSQVSMVRLVWVAMKPLGRSTYAPLPLSTTAPPEIVAPP